MVRRSARPPRMGIAAAGGGLVAVLAIALGVGTCGNGDDDGASNGRRPTTVPSTDGSTSTTLSVEQEVEAAYLAFADMGARLLEAPDPDDPEIAQRASGEAQGDLVDGLTTLRASNQRYELGPQYEHEILSVDVNDQTAVAEICVIDDVSLVDATTGETRESGLTTSRSSVVLTRQGSVWLVDDITEHSVEGGVVECV